MLAMSTEQDEKPESLPAKAVQMLGNMTYRSELIENGPASPPRLPRP
jgi:hypothetical protein